MNNTYPLVSIVTPCFNGEKYLDRYFNSLLSQSWPAVEVIFVNDGSTDDTEKIAMKYKRLLEEKGYSFVYIYQENAGQAEAFNRALPVFTGKFFTWFDCDDFITPDSVSKRAQYLNDNAGCAFVGNAAAFVSEDDIHKVIKKRTREKTDKNTFFSDLALCRGVCFSGAYMVRAECIREVIPENRIYSGQGGQNWQLLLPLAYKYECDFLPDILLYIVERAGSHSRPKSLHGLDTGVDKHEETVLTVIKGILPDSEYQKLGEQIKQNYANERLMNAYHVGTKKEFNKRLKRYRQKYSINREQKVLWLQKNIPLFNALYKKYRDNKMK